MPMQVLYMQRKVSKAACWREAYVCGTLRIFENKPPPQSDPCLLLQRGGGGYFWEVMVFSMCQDVLREGTK